MLKSSAEEYSKFAAKTWYIIDSKTKIDYSHHNQIKFLAKSIESSLCDYSNAYVLVTGDITVRGCNENIKGAFKSCALFKTCNTEINGTFGDEADFINIAVLQEFDWIQWYLFR